MTEPMITATHENGKMDPALAKALVALVAAMPAAPKDASNPHFGQSYASLLSIWEVVRPILKAHGFALIQQPMPSTDGVYLETHLIHESGAFLTARLIMPVRQKDNPQAIGSALTYARRYSMSAMLSIVTEEDDDGNAGAAGAPPRAAAPAPQTTRASLTAAAAPAPPRAEPAPATSQVWFGIIEKVLRREGMTGGRQWTLFTIHGQGNERFSTFDAKWSDAAKFLIGTVAKVTWTHGRRGKDLFSIEAAEGPEATAEPPEEDDENIPF